MGNFWKDARSTYEQKAKNLVDFSSANKQYDVILLAEEQNTPFTITGAKISVTKTNELQSTSLVNRRGSVKELIQEKDYAVTISGTLVGMPKVWWAISRKNSSECRFFCSAKSILVASTYLATFGIFRLAFKNTTFTQNDTINTLAYTLHFESDYTYDFDISAN